MTGTENGSALRPFATVQAALAAAATGDRILVAGGTYAAPIRIESLVVELRGGYEGGSSGGYAANMPGDFGAQDPPANPTTIQGTPADACVLLIDAGASVVDGFIITGGGGANEDAFRSQGGGVFVIGGAPTISNNRIAENDARDPKLESFGGGIYTESADTIIEGNTIASNQAGRGAGICGIGGVLRIRDNTVDANLANSDHGGGIYIFSPDVVISGNVVTRNEVGRELGYGWGGGILIFNTGASAMITDNLIAENFAMAIGGGVFIDEGATATMENCLILDNEAGPAVEIGIGAVYVDQGDMVSSHLTMRHCTIAGHRLETASLGGNGLFLDANSTATVENCIFWDNGGHSIFGSEVNAFTVEYSTTEEAYAGAGNLTGDPLFVDAAGGDFHLQSTAGHWVPGGGLVFDAATSPAIDAANPASPFLLEPIPNGGRADQGAYGNSAQASRTPVDAVTSVIVR